MFSFVQSTGPIPHQLANLTSLEGLYLDGNQLSGGCYCFDDSLLFSNGVTVALFDLVSVTVLTCEFGAIGVAVTGPIPQQLATLTNLQELYLNNNQLSGTCCDREFPSSLRQFGNQHTKIF